MLRFTHRLAEHVQSAAAHASPVYYSDSPRPFWQRRWRNFCRRGVLGKTLTLAGYGAAGLGAYLASCLVIRTMHQPEIDALFASSEQYTLEEWRTVEPTLRPGDIILMRGSGLMSWTIATLQFIFSFMHPSALRYSHVAVVVAPAVVEYVDEARDTQAASPPLPPYRVEKLEDVFEDAAQTVPAARVGGAAAPSQAHRSVHAQLQAEEAALRRRPVVRRSAILLEAMDNKDYDLPDVTGKVRYDCVQVVEAGRRIFSTTPTNTPAYHYFSVRRLQNYEHTPERQEKLKRFCLDSVGRKMDSSLLYPLAFMYPNLHTLTHPLRSAVTGEVSCSELIVELYQRLDIIQRHWRWVKVSDEPSAAAPASTAVAVKEDGAPVDIVVSPSPADATHDRSANSLHVYDYVYGRVNDRAKVPVMSRERPVLSDAATVENGSVLVSPALRSRSAVAPLRPTWPELDARKNFKDFFGRELNGDAAEAARQRLKTRMSATYVRDDAAAAAGSSLLRAGDVAHGTDGATYQLQWYYQHNSVATCPYHFTEGAGEAVLDFDLNVGLGPEVCMQIHRPGDSSTWVLTDE